MVDAESGALGQVGIALTFGLVIMAMIYAAGCVSGAHLNPAVSVAFALMRRFPWPTVGAYVIAQTAGALAAAGLLRASLGDVAGGRSGQRSSPFEVETLWIYILAPVVGAALGALAYQLVRGQAEERHRSVSKPLPTIPREGEKLKIEP
jgi:glycerol uptake facilitator-like aquaporin